MASAGIAVLLLLWLLVRVRRARLAKERVTQRPATVAPKGTPKDPAGAYAMIYAREEHATRLTELLAIRCVRVTAANELTKVLHGKHPELAFVDVDLVPQLGAHVKNFPVVAIIDEPANATLSRAVSTLDGSKSLDHVIAAPLLASPLAKTHLSALVERLIHGPEHELIGASSVGRVAMLVQASHRETRFERMREYFDKQGVSSRAAVALQDVAEELVMNALYNAPTEAGFFKTAISRTEDVTLPNDRACEISYGMNEGNAFIRLRDTFGALRRERLLDVLTRCMKNTGVTLDESRGGAGLGMWRVFSSATTVAITVLPGQLTDILVQLAPKPGKGKQLLAVHLTFVAERVRDSDPLLLDLDSQLVDHSVTLLCA